ncbi:response regulator transcription factor [Antarcticimicrobium sediminis]|uniref:Response regulator transcription factor n=1 Tax=Antarcticimicrobium sediminis TaxID=2546227 RepID=A0A4V2Z834_9RHOB|nr:response regulator transcription factor [Antarcticimicrobium sediminis]TDE38886.1 response regulator transcription factor [Antarcticimicrobium sediminis]
MRAYVFEPREKRQTSLALELENAGIEPLFVDEDFFESGLPPLTQPGNEVRAILIGESDNTHAQIRTVRKAGCANPVIVLRDFRNSQDTSAALDRGADDVIVSPIKGSEVVSRINSIIRRFHGHAAESVEVGELIAFFDGRDPIVSGARIRLSKREHSIFQHLALNSNKVISKNAIYDAVYGMSADQPFDKVIDVYICKLRKKIAAAASSGAQYIETVHGRGYKLSAPDEFDLPAPKPQTPHSLHGAEVRA